MSSNINKSQIEHFRLVSFARHHSSVWGVYTRFELLFANSVYQDCTSMRAGLTQVDVRNSIIFRLHLAHHTLRRMGAGSKQTVRPDIHYEGVHAQMNVFARVKHARLFLQYR